jgi:signal peptidase I
MVWQHIYTKGNIMFLKRVAFASPIVFTFHQCVGSVAKVSGTSMQPTLNHADFPDRLPFFKDHVFINKIAARCAPHHGRTACSAARLY